MFEIFKPTPPRGDIQSQVIECLRFPLAVLVVLIHTGCFLGSNFNLVQIPPGSGYNRSLNLPFCRSDSADIGTHLRASLLFHVGIPILFQDKKGAVLN